MKLTLPVITVPNPVLRTCASPVEISEISKPEFQKFCDDMIKTMHEDDGIGLAAPQVARSIRVITIGADAFSQEKDLPFPQDEDLVLLNPEISNYSLKTALDDEACLSVPGVVGEVSRHTKISVIAVTREGKEISFTATDYFARVLQHELDHLNGILFIDRAKKVYKVEKKQVL